MTIAPIPTEALGNHVAILGKTGAGKGGGSFGTYLSRLAGPGLIERSGRIIRLSEEAMRPRR